MYGPEESGMLRVLRLLQSHGGEYLSGQDLSDVTGMSRVAVWKHVGRIRGLGYGVESGQSGYRLAGSPDVPYPWEIAAGLQTRLLGQRAYYFESAGSTQDEARKLASRKDDGAVVIAGTQTAGRGRAGKRWASARGGIFMSLIMYPEFGVGEMTLFPAAVSLALAAAAERALGAETELRWPNDVTIGGKKVAGILVDAEIESGRVGAMITGAGINYDADTAALEEELAGAPGFYGAATFSGPGRVELVRAFLEETERNYDALRGGGAAGIVSEWEGRSSTIGSRVSVMTRDGEVSGTAERMDPDGALVIGGARVAAGDLY